MSDRLLTAGVLGGMGPAATIDFMAKVLAHSQARRGAGSREQQDVRLIVDSNPALDDRNAAIAGSGPSPGPELAAMARGLAEAGADFLVMPCNTAHAFAADVREATPLPFVDMIVATGATILREHPGAKKVGVLAAAGAAEARLYERALEPIGLEATVPGGEARARFMSGIWAIKAGDLAAGRAAVLAEAKGLVAAGAELIVAGCTEVPLVLGACDLAVPLVDATDVLARATVDHAWGARFG